MDNEESGNKNETADLLRITFGPQLEEFMDGYMIIGYKVGTEKKLIAINPPSRDENKKSMYPMISAAEEWANIFIDI